MAKPQGPWLPAAPTFVHLFTTFLAVAVGFLIVWVGTDRRSSILLWGILTGLLTGTLSYLAQYAGSSLLQIKASRSPSRRGTLWLSVGIVLLLAVVVFS